MAESRGGVGDWQVAVVARRPARCKWQSVSHRDSLGGNVSAVKAHWAAISEQTSCLLAYRIFIGAHWILSPSGNQCRLSSKQCNPGALTTSSNDAKSAPGIAWAMSFTHCTGVPPIEGKPHERFDWNISAGEVQRRSHHEKKLKRRQSLCQAVNGTVQTRSCRVTRIRS